MVSGNPGVKMVADFWTLKCFSEHSYLWFNLNLSYKSHSLMSEYVRVLVYVSQRNSVSVPFSFFQILFSDERGKSFARNTPTRQMTAKSEKAKLFCCCDIYFSQNRSRYFSLDLFFSTRFSAFPFHSILFFLRRHYFRCSLALVFSFGTYTQQQQQKLYNFRDSGNLRRLLNEQNNGKRISWKHYVTDSWRDKQWENKIKIWLRGSQKYSYLTNSN